MYKIKLNKETEAVNYGFCANNEAFNNRLSPLVNKYQIDSCLLKIIKCVTMHSFICTNQPETELTLCSRRINSKCSITHPSPFPVNLFKILGYTSFRDSLQRAASKLRFCTVRISMLYVRIPQTVIKIDITVIL